MTTIILRPYQESSIQKARDKIASGSKRILINAPTGAGKTVIAAGIVQRAVAKGKKVLFLAHRRELIYQTCAKLVDDGVLNFGVIMAGQHLNNAAAPVQVASIQTLIRRELPEADLVVIDECLTGDSLVLTDKGLIQIKDIRPRMRAVSYNGSKVVYSEITDVWMSGEKDVLEIAVTSGEKIRCTENHLVMTKDGWKKASEITTESLLLLASADAGRCCTKITGEGSKSAYQGISGACSPKVTNNGGKSTSHYLKTLLFALADVVRELAQNVENPWSNLFVREVLGHFTSLFRAMTNAVSHGISLWRNRNEVQSLVPCLATQASCTRIKEAPPLALRSIMESLKPHGQSIKHIILHGLDARSRRRIMQDTVLSRFLERPDVYQRLRIFTTSASRMAKSLSLANGSIKLATSALLGGFVTMDHVPCEACSCIQRDTLWQRMKSFASGSLIIMEQQVSIPERVGTIGFIYQQTLKEKFCQLLSNTYPSPCNTNWRHVASVRRLPQKEIVYDITVAGTHCFFANGILTHNCHRANSKSYLSLLSNYQQSVVIGLTATPERLDGKGLDDIFHDMVVVATVPDLIAMGFLVKPVCYVGSTGDLSGVRTRRGDYDESQLAEAMDKPTLTGDIVANWLRLARGRPTAIFATSVEHAKHITAEFMAAGISAATVTGETPQNERDAIIADWRAGYIQVCVNVYIFVEGFDFPELECVVLARPTQSVSLFLQAVGRVMRPAPGKQQAIILDHAGCCQMHGQPHLHREWSLEGMRKKRSIEAQQVCQACTMVFDAIPTMWLEETQPDLRKAFIVPAQRLLSGSEKNRGMATCPGCSAATCLVCGSIFEVRKTKHNIDGIAVTHVASCQTCGARYSDVPKIITEEHEVSIPTTTQDNLVAMDDAIPIKVTVLNDYKRLINEAKRHGRKRGWAYWRLKEKYSDKILRDCLPRHTGTWWKEQA